MTTDTGTTPTTDTPVGQEISALVQDIQADAVLEAQAEKGIIASKESANQVRALLEQELSATNFNMVDELNTRFADFIQYEAVEQRLSSLLEEASAKGLGQDVGTALDATMKDIKNITSSLSTEGVALQAGGFFGWLRSLFTGRQRDEMEIFRYGVSTLKGKVERVNAVIAAEEQDIEQVISMTKHYLPQVTEDIIRLEYLSQFLDKFTGSSVKEKVSDQALEFIREYQMAVEQMKQVSSVSVLRIMMGLNRIVKAKFTLDKVEMKFTMNLGTLVLENMVSNQTKSAYDIAQSIESGIDSLEQTNVDLAKANQQVEIDRKSGNLGKLKSLEAKLAEIQNDNATYQAELTRLNDETRAYLPQYREAYKQLMKMREEIIGQEKAQGAALTELLQADEWNEAQIAAQHQQLMAEVADLPDTATVVAQRTAAQQAAAQAEAPAATPNPSAT